MTIFFTIGHSTRSLNDFIGLLRESSIALLADVRHFPRSRTNPQFNCDTLPDELAQYQIGYAAITELGGRRGRSEGESPNGLWRVQAFRNYADYALTPPFAEGLARLIDLGCRQRTAIMCSEAVWWRCHRRIITDYLLARGFEVCHILGPGHVDPARMTPGAVVTAEGQVLYPAP